MKNQCDGCRRRLGLLGGNHVEANGQIYMGCTASLYQKPEPTAKQRAAIQALSDTFQSMAEFRQDGSYGLWADGYHGNGDVEGYFELENYAAVTAEGGFTVEGYVLTVGLDVTADVVINDQAKFDAWVARVNKELE